MQPKEIYENKGMGILILMGMFLVIYYGLFTLDIYKIHDNFISVPIYMLMTIGIVIIATILINVLEGALIKAFKIFNCRYFTIYPFTYEVGKIRLRPFNLIMRTCMLNDAYLLNLIDFSKDVRIKLQKRLFLLRIISMYSTASVSSLFMYYYTNTVMYVLILFIAIMLLHLFQHFHWEDWKGDAYLMQEDEIISYFLKFTIQDINDAFLDNIEPLIGCANSIEWKIDYLDRYIDVLILNDNIQINLPKIIKYYEFIKNEFTEKIALDQTRIFLSLIRIQNSIGIIGVLRNDYTYIDQSIRLKKEFNASTVYASIQDVEDFSKMNFSQDRLFASGAKRNSIIKKLIMEMKA